MTRTTRRRLAPALLAIAALAAASTGAAQVPTLDRVDSLIAAGHYDDARATLDRWWSARESFQVPGSDQVRGLLLRARLQPDPAAAETDYLTIVLGHPTSPHAAEALLRLGQGLLAKGEPARAAGYLQRLAADYPGRTQRTAGMLWLARAQSAARNSAAACRAARDGLADAGADPDLAAMLRLEAAASCSLAAADEPPPTQPRPAQPRPQEARPTAGAPAAAAATGDFAVQTGAFRYREGADALMARLREAGFEPRAVRVPVNDLLRIRVGRFATADQARQVVDALRRAGFDALVVSDAARERAP